MSSNELHLLAGDGGITEPPSDSRDPFQVLDELMQVVESLCTTYPERDIFRDDGSFKL